jgi:hypothetical protein
LTKHQEYRALYRKAEVYRDAIGVVSMAE